jgi:hypothetical protein
MTTSARIAPTLATAHGGFARRSVAVAVLAVGGTFCIAAAGLAMWPQQTAPAAEVEALKVAPVRLRCDTCGVIETIRHSEAKEGAEAFYEFDVRLPDGSLRHSRNPQAGAWQVGQKMQLLGGERTWSAR